MGGVAVATKKPVVAMMYDFDKTLCSKNMQEYSFIPNMGLSEEEFWTAANELSKSLQMDGILAYMWLMINESKKNSKSIHRKDFVKLGKALEFYDGVSEWFDRINEYGREVGVQVEHYIISSGLREIIEGSSIYKKFKDVYACEYMYDENDIACWPKNVVNYTTKTQFLFRINKGVSDLSDDKTLNDFVPEDERRVPFRNMIYIADGITDVPCMKLVKINGGYSIAVYQKKKKDQANELLKNDRVNFVAQANYKEGSELDKLVKDVISEIALKDSLVRKNLKQKK
ncbi:MAG: haloacid dehalogenase-like hydrolase [Eubacterium sp.]|nr:haloacid dehalogenase-like hydrolase [Eubacterium sp.]